MGVRTIHMRTWLMIRNSPAGSAAALKADSFRTSARLNDSSWNVAGGPNNNFGMVRSPQFRILTRALRFEKPERLLFAPDPSGRRWAP
jgi:hypothetical protein